MSAREICSRCVLDRTVEDIEFDADGVCNYCRGYEAIIKTVPTGMEAEKVLAEKVERIKAARGKHGYDCIIGISGGVDSTYLAHLVKKHGLTPLAVHIDTGWNSEIAVKNIENLVNKLDIDLFTVVIDWAEMRELQLAFFRASLPDCDIPQDHVFPAELFKIAEKFDIKHVISGHNLVTEYVLPRSWSYDSNDLEHIKDVNRKCGSRKLANYPQLSLFKRTIYYKFIRPIQVHRFLYYVPYDKEQIKIFIERELGWKDYGGKHFESRFTKFFQSYYLVEKFGYDKRKAHLSNLIVSGQMSRDEALAELKNPPYIEADIRNDIDFVLSKLNCLNSPLNKSYLKKLFVFVPIQILFEYFLLK